MFKVTVAEETLNLWPRSWALGISNMVHKEGPHTSFRKLQCWANLVNNALLTTLRFRCQSPSTCVPWAPHGQECYKNIPSPPTFGGDSGTLPCQTGPLEEFWIKSWVLSCDFLTSCLLSTWPLYLSFSLCTNLCTLFSHLLECDAEGFCLLYSLLL